MDTQCDTTEVITEEIIQTTHKKVEEHKNTITKFLSVSEIVSAMVNTPTVSKLPTGPKENVYFNVLNAQNQERSGKGKRQQWWDDCGAYLKSSTVTTHLLTDEDNNFKELTYIKGEYKSAYLENGKRKFKA